MTDVLKLAKHYLCLEMSEEGFVCNREPNHDGDHVASARGPGDVETFEVDRWPARSTDSKESTTDE